MIRFFLIMLLLFVVAPVYADDSDDPRAYNHGISAVSDSHGGYWVFFSSSGLRPTGEDDDGNWTHDIYVGRWRAGQGKLDPKIFIGKPEAQEPVSVARVDDGHILVTLEDGWDTYGEVEQRYGVYDAALNPIKPYPNTVSDGGHSGHAVASGDHFIIFYSDEWIEGGGVDGLGTGGGVYARIYGSNGQPEHHTDIAAHVREWWPLISASHDRALLVWQAYVKDETYAQLKFSMLDPVTGEKTTPQILRNDLQYYTYDTAYIPNIDRFLIVGTARDKHGFAYLVDGQGTVTAQIPCMPPVMREASIAVMGSDAFMPSPGRLLRLTATADTLTLSGVISSPLTWSTVGSLGLPDGPNRLHWFSLAKSGLQEAVFDVKNAHPPSAQDFCH